MAAPSPSSQPAEKNGSTSGLFGTEDADAAYKDWLSEWAKGTLPKPGERTRLVKTHCAQYEAHAESYYGRKSSEYAAIHVALKRFGEFAPNKVVEQIGPGLLTAFQSHLVENEFATGEGENAKFRSLSRRTVNRYCGLVIRAVKWASGRELIPPALYHGLLAFQPLKAGKSAARESLPVKPVPLDVVKKTLPHLPMVVAEMVQLQFACAMRPAEVCRMRVELIDRSGPVWLYRPTEHKNASHGKSLTKAVPSTVQGLLSNRIGKRTTGYVFSPADALPEHLAKAERHTKPLGECYRTSSYAVAIKRACRAAGIDLWSPNQLRHAAATLAKSQLGWSAAQTLLGYSSPDITQIYVDQLEADLVDAASKLELPSLTSTKGKSNAKRTRKP